ncbi:hypothetical protein GW17_00027083 [Ensete ventricosum]|nr:hypothetical protein GW17_00027083 [Ensete ventricosum]
MRRAEGRGEERREERGERREGGRRQAEHQKLYKASANLHGAPPHPSIRKRGKEEKKRWKRKAAFFAYTAMMVAPTDDDLTFSYQFHSPTISPSPSPSSTPPLPSSSTSSTWDRACLCSPSVAELVARDWGGGDGEELRVLVGDLGWDSRSLWIFRCRR